MWISSFILHSILICLLYCNFSVALRLPQTTSQPHFAKPKAVTSLKSSIMPVLKDTGLFTLKSCFAFMCTALITTNTVWADSDDSKAAKKFELCLSKCVFEETRPPPLGSSSERLEVQRSRGEIIRDCRSKCAKTPEQMLLGKPKSSKPSQDNTQLPINNS